MTSTSPVIVQTTRVSMKVPVMETSAWRTGESVLAAAAAIGAEPSPASLENTPRATPMRMTVPMAPPATASPVNASVRISFRAGITSSTWQATITIPPRT